MTGTRSMLTRIHPLRALSPLASGPALAAVFYALGCSAAPSDEASKAPRPPPPSPHPSTVAAASAKRAPLESATPSATPLPSRTEPGRVVEAILSSEALGADKRLFVYLPGGYDASETRYPVIYLLHGLGGTERAWVSHGKLPEAADAMGLPAIVVMPDGDASFYANAATETPKATCMRKRPPFSAGEEAASFCVEHPRYDDYMTRDLIAHVDATYRTIARREARAVTGISMGGFGAMSLAMRHPDVYSSAASHSGLLSLLYEAPHPYQTGKVRRASTTDAWGGRFPGRVRTHIMGIFGPRLDVWRAHDPVVLAEQLEPDTLSLFIDCGEQDGFMLYDDAKHMHDVLTERGVKHTFQLVPGAHSFELWKERLPASLAFHLAHFRSSAPEPSSMQ